jgi:hypothetical protein
MQTFVEYVSKIDLEKLSVIPFGSVHIDRSITDGACKKITNCELTSIVSIFAYIISVILDSCSSQDECNLRDEVHNFILEYTTFN